MSNAADTQLLDIPSNKNGTTLTDYNDAIRKLAETFHVNVINFANCGIDYQNFPQYLGDYKPDTKHALHPNRFGHSLLANTAIKTLVPDYKPLLS